MSRYAITNTDNYFDVLNETLHKCVSIYININILYIKHYKEILEKTHSPYEKQILLTGFNALNNIFLFLILKTRNLNLTIHNCEKTIFYFFEFIEQMKKPKHDIQSILKLSVKDAKLFVFKKTIYDIKPTSINMTENEKNIFDNLRRINSIFSNAFEIIANQYNENLQKVLDCLNELDKKSLIECDEDIILLNFQNFDDFKNYMNSKLIPV